MGVHFSTGRSAFAYKNLREHLGLNTENIEMPDTVQCLARVDEDIIDRFNIDTYLLWHRDYPSYKFNFRDDYSFIVPKAMQPIKQSDGSHTLEYGDKISFLGGCCDIQRVLSLGSVEDVKENVRNLMASFGPNSGFIFNQVHNIMGDIPPEKIIAMYDTAFEEAKKYDNLNV